MIQHVKVPAIVGAILTALAGVLTALSTIPAIYLYCTIGVSIVNTAIPLLDYAPGLTTFAVPATVGVVLTAVSAGLVALATVPAAAIYATAAASAINAIVPLFRYDAAGKPAVGLRVALSTHPKVKVPAIVGTVVTVALAVLGPLAGVPALAPYITAAMTVLQFLSGYLTPATAKVGEFFARLVSPGR